MKRLLGIVLTIVILAACVMPFSVFAAEEPVYSIKLKASIDGANALNTKYEFTVTCYDMLESEDEAEPLKAPETVTLDTDKATYYEYKFDPAEVEFGGIRYEFKMRSVSNSSIAPDTRAISVYLCSSTLVKTVDSTDPEKEDEKEFDMKDGFTVSGEFKCLSAKEVKVVTAEGKTATKVYDGTADAEIKSDMYKLVGVAEGSDVKLSYTSAVYNSKNVKDATKVTVSGLSLTGNDAAKYKLKTTKLEYKATITKKPVTVTADDIVMTKGAAEPELTYKLSEPLCEGDTATGALARTTGSELGEYIVTLGTLSFGDNYEVTFEAGKFTVSNFTSNEVVDPASGVKIAGYFESGSSLKVTPLTESDLAYVTIKGLSSFFGKVVCSYEIKLQPDNHDGNLAVSFPVPAEYEGHEMYVYQYTSNNKLNCYKTAAINGLVTVNASELTDFVIMTDFEENAEKKTSVFLTVLKVIGIILLVIIGIALIFFLILVGMVFFNRTKELKAMMRFIKRLFGKNKRKYYD